MYVQRHELSLETGTGTSAEAFTGLVDGRVLSVHYRAGGSAGLATAGTITVRSDRTGQDVLSVAAATGFDHAPRQGASTPTGGSATGGSPGRDFFYAGAERIKVTATGAAAGKTATVRILTG